MSAFPRRSTLAALGAVAFLAGPPVQAETLQCRSVNGNVTCAGSGGASCQTVNGRTTCVSGSGSIVQRFGPGTRSAGAPAIIEDDDVMPAPGGLRRLRIERQGAGGSLWIERDGGRLRLRGDGLSIDLD